MNKPRAKPTNDELTGRLARMFSDLATGVTAVELCRGNANARTIVAAALLEIATGTLADDGMSREAFLQLAAKAFDGAVAGAAEESIPPPVGTN